MSENVVELQRLNLIEHGNCAAFPTGWWMPEDIDVRGVTNLTYETYDKETATRAKELCADCRVKDECLAWASRDRAVVIGIWGGTTLAERRRARKGPTYPRRTCLECGMSRKLKFFTDDGLAVCVDCQEVAKAEPRWVGCDVAGCPSRHMAKGLCNRHYLQEYRGGGIESAQDGPGRPRVVPDDEVMSAAFRAGESNARLAELWGVTPATVRTHRRRLELVG